jgi:hypothetical protein
MFNVNYTGLRKRETYDEVVDYLDNQPKIKYPDRRATQIRNSLYMTNLLDGDGDMEQQQNKAMKNTEVEHRIREEASRTNSTAQHFRMDTGGYNTPNSGYSFSSQFPPSATGSEIIDIMDDLAIEQDGIDEVREARGKRLMKEHLEEVNSQLSLALKRKREYDVAAEPDKPAELPPREIINRITEFFNQGLISDEEFLTFNDTLHGITRLHQNKQNLGDPTDNNRQITKLTDSIKRLYHKTLDRINDTSDHIESTAQAASSSNSKGPPRAKAKAKVKAKAGIKVNA